MPAKIVIKEIIVTKTYFSALVTKAICWHNIVFDCNLSSLFSVRFCKTYFYYFNYN